MNEEKFIKGLFTQLRENAPDFVLANLSFKTEQFIEWLKNHTNAKGYCNVDILRSKEGVVYSKYNDWQPKEKFVKNDDGSVDVKMDEEDTEKMNEIITSKIPF